jgi:hypothetical protein
MGQHYGQLCSRVLDSMDRDGFVITLSKFGHIYDSVREYRFIGLVQRVVAYNIERGSADTNLYIKVKPEICKGYA